MLRLAHPLPAVRTPAPYPRRIFGPRGKLHGKDNPIPRQSFIQLPQQSAGNDRRVPIPFSLHAFPKGDGTVCQNVNWGQTPSPQTVTKTRGLAGRFQLGIAQGFDPPPEVFELFPFPGIWISVCLSRIPRSPRRYWCPLTPRR